LKLVFPPIDDEDNMDDFIENQIEVDGEKYFAGFMAKKLKHKFECMGKHSHKIHALYS
jgi:87kDa Transposase